MKHQKCQTCGRKLPPYHDDERCDDCWEKEDRTDTQLKTCVMCGAEVFDQLEICDGCREDKYNINFEND